MEATYNIPLVVLSYVVSVFGSYTALQLAIGIPRAEGGKLWLWLVGAAVALGGGGIWSMHFIAMLAYEMQMPVSYDVALTVASLAIAVVFVAAGLWVVGRGQGQMSTLMIAGLVTGLGVATMHYTGMAAMQMPGEIVYDYTIVGISVVIAVVASAVALWLAFNLRGNWQRFGSALVMGVAVCGMHYTGMVAMSIVESGAAAPASAGLDTQLLAGVIFGVTAVILVILLLMARMHLRQAEAYTYVR